MLIAGVIAALGGSESVAHAQSSSQPRKKRAKVRPLAISLIAPVGLFQGDDIAVRGISVNLIYGVHESVKGIEIGFINRVKGDFAGIQLGVGANIVRGKAYCVLCIGFLQFHDHVRGIQIGGGSKGIEGKGFQFGFLHRYFKYEGLQIGVINSVLVEADGIFQIGVLNLNNIVGVGTEHVKHIEGFMKGVQIGVINTAYEVRGVQIGAFNAARERVKGLQIGLLNFTKHLDGVQIGVLNIAYKNGLPVMVLINAGW